MSPGLLKSQLLASKRIKNVESGTPFEGRCNHRITQIECVITEIAIIGGGSSWHSIPSEIPLRFPVLLGNYLAVPQTVLPPTPR